MMRNITAHGTAASAASGDELVEQTLQEQQDEPARPISPPKTQRGTSTRSSPFLISTSNEGDRFPVNVKKKGRFTVKTTSTEVEDTNFTVPRAMEPISTQPSAVKATVMAKLWPRLSSDKPRNARVNNYDTIGLTHVAVASVENQTLPDEPRRFSHESLKSCDSYISDDSSSSDGLDPYSNDEISPIRHGADLETSPDINMTYSPEHPHIAGRSQVASDETATAAQNISDLYVDAVNLIGHNSKESMPNFGYRPSSLPTSLGNDQERFNIDNLLSNDQFNFTPLTQLRRSSSANKRSVRPPTLKMRCNSDPLFCSNSSGNAEGNNLNIANDSVESGGNEWASYSSSGAYSSDNSESIDEDLPARMSTPLSSPDVPSGRKVPVHIDSNTPTPTHAGGARRFFSNQESAQKVAELQATVPLAHHPYLEYDEALTPQSSSNTNTPVSTGTGCYTDEDDRDHMYWKSNAASFPDLTTDNLHPSRWAMLLYLSLLNLLSGWVCFSLAPVAKMLKGDVEEENLVSYFLIASAFATFCTPSTISCLGVRRTVLLGAILLIVGLNVCCSSDLFEGLRVGFIIAGLSQPLYQTTPIFIVAAWFPPNEQETMLRAVLHSNHLGVLFSFLSGTFLVSSESDIITYFQCIMFIASILFIAVVFHFQEVPPTLIPQTHTSFKDAEHTIMHQHSGEPDDGALEFQYTNDTNTDESIGIISTDLSKEYVEQLKGVAGHSKSISYGSNNFSYGSIEPSSPFPHLQGSFTSLGHHGELAAVVPQQDAETIHSEKTTIRNDQVWKIMKSYFSKEGSIRCSIAFVTSGVVVNSLITFMSYLLGTSGSNPILLAVVGSAFQFFIMISPIFVDKWTNPLHKHSLLSASLLAGVVALMMCMIAMEWESPAGLISSLLAVALIVGCSQTLSTGRGIEISQMSESSVLVVFQLLSNTFSSMTIPLFRLFQADAIAKSAPEFSLPFIFLIAMNMIAATCFFGGNRTSSSKLQRQSERYPFLLTTRTVV